MPKKKVIYSSISAKVLSIFNQSIYFRNGGLENRNTLHDNDNVQPLTEVWKGCFQH